jgi:hypothetical protein
VEKKKNQRGGGGAAVGKKVGSDIKPGAVCVEAGRTCGPVPRLGYVREYVYTRLHPIPSSIQ